MCYECRIKQLDGPNKGHNSKKSRQSYAISKFRFRDFIMSSKNRVIAIICLLAIIAACNSHIEHSNIILDTEKFKTFICLFKFIRSCLDHYRIVQARTDLCFSLMNIVSNAFLDRVSIAVAAHSGLFDKIWCDTRRSICFRIFDEVYLKG